MKGESFLSDMLPFHLEPFVVVRDVGSLGPALLFPLSRGLSLTLKMHVFVTVVVVVVAVVTGIIVLFLVQRKLLKLKYSLLPIIIWATGGVYRY